MDRSGAFRQNLGVTAGQLQDEQQSPSHSKPKQLESLAPKIKLKLKAPSMFPDLPTDDSEYEKKIIQRVVKAAIAKLKTNDYQVRP